MGTKLDKPCGFGMHSSLSGAPREGWSGHATSYISEYYDTRGKHSDTQPLFPERDNPRSIMFPGGHQEPRSIFLTFPYPHQAIPKRHPL
eukprot:5289473-Pyramimonas_sp.AAC.1